MTMDEAYRRLVAMEDRSCLPIWTQYPAWRDGDDFPIDHWPATALALAIIGDLGPSDDDDEQLLAAVRRGNDAILNERLVPLDLGITLVARSTLKLLEMYYSAPIAEVSP